MTLKASLLYIFWQDVPRSLLQLCGTCLGFWLFKQSPQVVQTHISDWRKQPRNFPTLSLVRGAASCVPLDHVSVWDLVDVSCDLCKENCLLFAGIQNLSLLMRRLSSRGPIEFRNVGHKKKLLELIMTTVDSGVEGVYEHSLICYDSLLSDEKFVDEELQRVSAIPSGAKGKYGFLTKLCQHGNLRQVWHVHFNDYLYIMQMLDLTTVIVKELKNNMAFNYLSHCSTDVLIALLKRLRSPCFQ